MMNRYPLTVPTWDNMPRPTGQTDAARAGGKRRTGKTDARNQAGSYGEGEPAVAWGRRAEAVEPSAEQKRAEASAEKTDAEAAPYADALRAFVAAYNRLLQAASERTRPDKESLRTAVYAPVTYDSAGRQISLYEIGVAHAPNPADTLAIQEDALRTAIKTRFDPVAVLLTKEGEGLLPRLRNLAESPPFMLEAEAADRDMERETADMEKEAAHFLQALTQLEAIWRKT